MSSCSRFLVIVFSLFFLYCPSPNSSAALPDYSTYFGGPSYEGAFAVAVDAAGNAYVAGGTKSTKDLPTLNAVQPAYGGGVTDGFLAKYSSTGQLLFASYFGGSVTIISMPSFSTSMEI
jgi:hypothetical protein